MAGEIRINIITDSQGADAIGKAADALNDLGKAGQQAGDGLGGTTKGATDLLSSLALLTGAAGGTVALISDLNNIGTAGINATAGLNALSSGKADEYLKRMRTETHGLVDDFTLTRDAALGLSTGIASNSAQMARLAGIGSTLGNIFQNDAAGGVTAFYQALERPGNTRPLAALGLDIAAVRTEFAKLKSDGLDQSSAWVQTLADQGGAAVAKLGADIDNGPGSAVKKLSADWNDFKQSVGEMAANAIEIVINLKTTGGIPGTPAAASAMVDPMSDYRRLGSQTPRISQYGYDTGGSTSPYGNGNLYIDGPDVPEATGSRSGGPGRGGNRNQGDPWFTMYNSDAYMNAAANTPARSRRELEQMDPGSGLSGGDGSLGNWGANANAANFGGRYAPSTGFSPEILGMQQAAVGVQAYNAELQKSDIYLQNAYQTVTKIANTSLAQAFGTTSGGIGGEIGGGLSADVSANRADLVKKGASKAELARFDDQAKSALDNYKIATGQATPESIKFGDALSSVDKAARAGKISTAEAANEYLALAKAAKDGATSVGQIEALMGTMSGTGGTTTTTHVGHSMVRGQEDAGGGAGRKTGVTPFDDVKKGADDTLTKVNALASAMPDVGVQATAAAGVTVAANARITGSYIIATGAALALAAAQRLVHP